MPHPVPRPPLPLPPFLLTRIDAAALALMQPARGPVVDFTQPRGEAALAAPDSVSWRVFKNPVALFVGGIAAVILELAEPRVGAGVWDHSSFRTDPVTRLQRTGLAAMITVYGARSTAAAMISGVVRMHGKVAGRTPDGAAYQANDIDLLNWVQATASFGFVEAYSRFVSPLSGAEHDRFYAEAPAARLYGARGAPGSDAERQVLFEAMRPRLAASPTIFEFLDIMRNAPAFPTPLRPLQRLLVRAAVDMTPDWARDILGLTARHGLRRGELALVRWAGRMSDRLMLPSSPAVQACRRLGLPADYLYRSTR